MAGSSRMGFTRNSASSATGSGSSVSASWRARVDLSSARITLYRTKSGKPRGVPINRAVSEALIALEPDQDRRGGRLFQKPNDRA
jgi:hypothetical protein